MLYLCCALSILTPLHQVEHRSPEEAVMSVCSGERWEKGLDSFCNHKSHSGIGNSSCFVKSPTTSVKILPHPGTILTFDFCECLQRDVINTCLSVLQMKKLMIREARRFS